MSEIIYLDPRLLHPMKDQPRLDMDEGKILGLMSTFEEKGFRGAIVIWYPRPDYAEIISGHRSWTAFNRVGGKHNWAAPWDKIPCAPFRDIDEGKAYELAILYNEKREDLTLFELAVSWSRLIAQYGYEPKQVAIDFETSAPTVYNTISSLEEPEVILNAVKAGKLKLPDVLGLRRIADINKRKKVAQDLMDGKIAKSQLPSIAAQLNRQAAVLALIPELEGELEETDDPVAPTTRMKLFVPDNFTLYFTFAASTRIQWETLPQRNILVSGYHVLHRTGKQAMVVDMIKKRDLMDSLMIDSAAIVAMSKRDTAWFDQQPALVDFANAVNADVVSHLDILCKPGLLEKCKMTVAEAQKKTIANALQMMDLKTKAKKCYVLQGHTAEEFGVCIDAYKELGIFEEKDAIVGVGSQAGERRNTTVERYKYVCEKVRGINPNIGIHAFGIGSPWTLVQLYQMGVTQADNQTPHVLTRVNKWIDARSGEPAKDVRLCDDRVSAMFNSQLLWNYAAYYVGLSEEFKRQLSYAPVDAPTKT